MSSLSNLVSRVFGLFSCIPVKVKKKGKAIRVTGREGP
jgi:hypothetical protein